MNKILRLTILSAIILSLQSCGKLSGEAKHIVGNYAIPELSQDVPVMELNRDASCVIRAIRPDVLSYSVHGTWNVENDSLVMLIDPSSLEVESGDPLLVGDIPTRAARKVAGYTDLSLELENDGVRYFFKKIK